MDLPWNCRCLGDVPHSPGWALGPWLPHCPGVRPHILSPPQVCGPTSSHLHRCAALHPRICMGAALHPSTSTGVWPCILAWRTVTLNMYF